MRGRKLDSEFLSNFISECVINNKTSADDILNEAKSQISVIDNKIKEVELLRARRCKLLDVVFAFEKQNSCKEKSDSKMLQFFKINKMDVCKFICDSMKDSAISVESLYNKGYSIQDLVFCIKQLLEHKVISRTDNYLLRGEFFKEYLEFILLESK